ncbi:MAG: GGDEF domain-containing protein [Pirellulales bacterium]|nr:GGDEF domain-containing protein [Pirellulales bacterium]
MFFNASTDLPNSSSSCALPGVVADEAEVTMQSTESSLSMASTERSCLVQIYPPDVVDGMMLLEADQFTVGRDALADLVVPDHSVSRRHAELVRHELGFFVRDLGSTNGTFVNGQLVEEQQLNSGDTIRFGSFLFRFLSAGSVESQYHETVYSALTRDALTGTMNKRYLLESMQREIARSARQQLVLSLLMFDIDHFKQVNDTHGHLVGDEVLREFGKRIQQVCREDDLLARYGGEEFCLMLSATPRAEALEMAERCRVVIADQPFATVSGPLPVTASFGLACLESHRSITPNELIEQADQRLYEAKRNGRNQVCG